MTGPKGYHWLHIPSGTQGTTEFVPQHAIEAGTALYPNGCIEETATYKLIAKWNAASSDWKYWL